MKPKCAIVVLFAFQSLCFVMFITNSIPMKVSVWKMISADGKEKAIHNEDINCMGCGGREDNNKSAADAAFPLLYEQYYGVFIQMPVVDKSGVKSIRVVNGTLTGEPTSKSVQVVKTVERRGRLSGCTLTDIKKRPSVVLLTTTNNGFLNMTLNLLESIKRAGVCVNTTVMAEDETAYRSLLKRAEADPAVRIQKTDSGETESGKLLVYTAKYNVLTKKRQKYILTLLQQGLEVLFTDADTFWFRDPFSYFQGDFDMSFVDERSPYPTRLQKKSLYCAGLGYFKPTNRTILFVKKWIEIMGKTKAPDQGVLNKMTRNDIPMHVNVRPLPVDYFPHALVFPKPAWQARFNETIIMHAVGLRGFDKKVELFRRYNMWLMNTTATE